MAVVCGVGRMVCFAFLYEVCENVVSSHTCVPTKSGNCHWSIHARHSRVNTSSPGLIICFDWRISAFWSKCGVNAHIQMDSADISLPFTRLSSSHTRILRKSGRAQSTARGHRAPLRCAERRARAAPRRVPYRQLFRQPR